jgi:uncharacterized protein (TIGR02145 family)
MKRGLAPALIITEVLIFLLMTTCEYDIRPPCTGKTSVSFVSTTEAFVESQIIWDGGADIKACGFCWNTSGHPTKADSHSEAEEVNEIFSGWLKNLSEGSKYYVRSYAINKAGTYYSEVKMFITQTNKLPVVNTPWITFVSHNTVELSGGGIVDNTYDIFSKGICWSTSGSPTINDQKVDLGSGFGWLGCKIEGLTPGTVYYLRAYATNVLGTAYGGNRVIRTFDGYATDYEGHVYSTVRLGDQEWMTGNLQTIYFSNGNEIKTTYPPNLNTENEDQPVYQWMSGGYGGFQTQAPDGRLYTWYTVTDSRNLCPTGWHVPSIDEWNELLDHLGGDSLTTRDFIWANNYHWDSPANISATEGSFCAQTVGFRDVTGGFHHASDYGTYWWSASEASPSNGYVIHSGYDEHGRVVQTNKNKKSGFTVRCVKD